MVGSLKPTMLRHRLLNRESSAFRKHKRFPLDQLLQVVVLHVQITRSRRNVRVPEERACRVQRPAGLQLPRTGLVSQVVEVQVRSLAPSPEDPSSLRLSEVLQCSMLHSSIDA